MGDDECPNGFAVFFVRLEIYPSPKRIPIPVTVLVGVVANLCCSLETAQTVLVEPTSTVDLSWSEFIGPIETLEGGLSCTVEAGCSHISCPFATKTSGASNTALAQDVSTSASSTRAMNTTIGSSNPAVVGASTISSEGVAYVEGTIGLVVVAVSSEVLGISPVSASAGMDKPSGAGSLVPHALPSTRSAESMSGRIMTSTSTHHAFA